VKAQDIQVFNTEKLSALFERVMVASGTSNRQTKALAASVRDAVRDAGFAKPRMEGEENGEWIIVDCGAAVVHIMQPAIRQYYHLEDLWGETPIRLKFGADKPAAKAAEKAPAKAVAPAKTGSLKRASAANRVWLRHILRAPQMKKAEEKKAADRKKATGKRQQRRRRRQDPGSQGPGQDPDQDRQGERDQGAGEKGGRQDRPPSRPAGRPKAPAKKTAPRPRPGEAADRRGRQRVPDWAQTAWDDYAKRFPPELRVELKAVKDRTARLQDRGAADGGRAQAHRGSDSQRHPHRRAGRARAPR